MPENREKFTETDEIQALVQRVEAAEARALAAEARADGANAPLLAGQAERTAFADEVAVPRAERDATAAKIARDNLIASITGYQELLNSIDTQERTLVEALLQYSRVYGKDRVWEQVSEEMDRVRIALTERGSTFQEVEQTRRRLEREAEANAAERQNNQDSTHTMDREQFSPDDEQDRDETPEETERNKKLLARGLEDHPEDDNLSNDSARGESAETDEGAE